MVDISKRRSEGTLSILQQEERCPKFLERIGESVETICLVRIHYCLHEYHRLVSGRVQGKKSSHGGNNILQ